MFFQAAKHFKLDETKIILKIGREEDTAKPVKNLNQKLSEIFKSKKKFFVQFSEAQEEQESESSKSDMGFDRDIYMCIHECLMGFL